jgi:hypothetical protein
MMKKASDVFKSIRFAKLDPSHDKGPKGSTDDEEHYTVGEKEYSQQLAHVKKRAMMNTEEKKDQYDAGEYDQEGDMAKSDLRSIIANAKELHDMIEDADNLPEWCQNKITLAEDYISTVTNYMTAEMNEETIQEGRPSQRHPLEGHEYHKKSNEALIHIAKDAHAAAEAMKSHNTAAENKYRDQANDSATVRHFRKTSGMPDWYKKKYGHMKEEKDTTPPFDGPYTKSTGVVTDKSGAKHGPMSVVRHLARQAMKKQSASLKKPVKEEAMSNKAKIVKSLAKKKTGESEDKFQSEPIMTKSPTKNY